ncbi:MAG TPA: PAS domain S-box protein [Mariprofundaceae bacterium]|nr:PAS domain S-box protein [Mariprofundaceae bacterium]
MASRTEKNRRDVEVELPSRMKVETYYRVLLEHVSDAVLIESGEGHILDANPVACELLGYEREEIVGVSFRDIATAIKGAHVGEFPDKSQPEEKEHQESIPFRCKDGSVQFLDGILAKMPCGDFMWTLRPTIGPEQSSVDSARLAAIVESSDDAIIGKDLNGIISSWNSGAEKIFGYTAEEMVGTSIKRLIPNDRLDEEDHILGELRKGKKISHFETIRQTKDGRFIDVSVTISPIKDARGRIIGASKIARDISPLKERQRDAARMSRLYAALGQINQEIVRTSDHDKLLQFVCRILVEYGGFHLAWFGRYDPEQHLLVPVAGHGGAYNELLGAEFPLKGKGKDIFWSRVFSTRQRHICNDISNDVYGHPHLEGGKTADLLAYAVFPIWKQSQLCGVLSVYTHERNFFHGDVVILLEEIVSDISFAVESFAREEKRRQAEIRAARERAFSDTIIESMPGIVLFFDQRGNLLRWNRNLETLTGYSGSEIEMMQPLDFFAKEDRPSIQQSISAILEQGEASTDSSLISRKGRSNPYLLTGRRVVINGEPCLIMMGFDISRRKRIESRLRSSEENLAMAQRIAHLGSWENDLVRHRLAWSDETYRILSITPSESMPNYEAFMEVVHPADQAMLRQAQQRAINGEEELELEYRVVRKDGEVRWVYEMGNLERDAEGNPLRLTGAILDITERKQAEHALRDLNESLERQVALRTAELREALVRAESADEVKSRFLATMSHELRTPLNSIIGFTSTVLNGMAGPLTEEQSKQLEMVQQSARHLLELINDVLDISKIEANQLQIRTESFDLRGSLDRVISSMRPMAERKGIQLNTTITTELETMRSDRRRVEQILLNLINNAIKFTEEGMVSVRVGGGRPQGDGTLSPLRFEITDTGIGIETGDFATLFRPFHQIDGSIARQHEGTGLGLAICQRLAQLLEGEISVESEPSKGSTFTVLLPAQLEGVS